MPSPIAAPSLPIRPPTVSLSSETTIKPASAPARALEIPPASAQGRGTDVVPTMVTRAPRFRSGTLRIDLPPHVRPLDPERFLCGQSQVQQDASAPRNLAAHASFTHNGVSGIQPAVLVPPSSSTHVDRPVAEDEQNIPEAPAEPTGSASGRFQCAEQIQMRREPHDKPRRILAFPSGAILSVTMRGSLDFVAQAPLRCTALRTSASGDSTRQLTEDACVVPGTRKPIVVIGRAGNNQQLSLVRIKETKVHCLSDPSLGHTLTGM